MVNVICIPKNKGRGGGGGENTFCRPVNQTINYGLSPSTPTDANQLKVFNASYSNRKKIGIIPKLMF